MKKGLKVLIILSLLCTVLMAGCAKKPDKSIYKYARIMEGNGDPWNVKISSWEDYGSQVQIKTDAGMIILVDKSRVMFTNK